MNSCRFKDRINAYQLGLCSDEERRELARHLKHCPVCQKELALLKMIERELSEPSTIGAIEDRILLHLRELREPTLTLIDLAAALLYCGLFITGGLLILPIIIHLPFHQLGNLLSTLILNNITILFGIGIIFGIASSIYSLRLVGEY